MSDSPDFPARAAKVRTAPSRELIARFAAIVGPAHALAEPEDQARYLTEWRDTWIGRAPLVLRPGSTEEVARILRLAHDTGTPVVPQGGNTGLVGGQIPDESGTEIVISLERMSKVRSIDAAGYSMVVEAGLTLLEAQQAAEKADRYFALSLPSEGSARIGGNLSTNAGGVNVLAYGNARAQVLGLEVVLADGRVWDGLRALKKDNTGYDLKDLFIGAEGTLGIITAAVLKLHPRPRETATAFVAFAEIEQAIALFGLAQEHAGQSLTAFEVMSRYTLEVVLRHTRGTRDPFASAAPWYVLLEVSGLKQDGAALVTLERLLAEALDKGIIADANVATSLAQAKELWRIRESVSEAQKPEGGTIKHDISVPVPRVPEFIRRADALIERLCTGARPISVGHIGDGNIHYNVAQPAQMDKQAFLARWDEISDAVHGLVVEMGGSISAEHGIGRLKREAMARIKSEVELDMMRAIKAALDPKGIMNPGKVL
jgi:FAD/FMN-containing dehydrogenase